ncbi:hypothetical protein [Methanomethylophilus alvi]|uniref:hypothetical protein n=1 Tax=Methanomethylophilus alvi TaxID=1291540 RepID=UPI0037DCF78F
MPFLRVKKISDNEYDIELGKNFENYKSVWYDSLYDANKYGTQLISDMVPENDFDFPKSIYATYECLYSVVGDRPNAKVLDFFAGSGTTGHAVLMMNKLLGGNRTFVLCTNNDIGNKKEKEFKKAVGNPEDHPDEYADYCDKYGIARSITYPRIKAAIEGFQHTGKFNDELYSKRLTKTVLNKIESEVKKANKVLEDNSSKYGSIELTVKDDCIKVIGTYDKKEDVPGIPANLIYFKTAFVDKKLDDLDYLLSDALSPYCKDMIQLENWTSIPNQKYLIINTDDEAQEVEKDLSKMNGAQKIFYQTGVLLSSSIIDYANEHNILLLSLPSHYFAKELDEVGE